MGAWSIPLDVGRGVTPLENQSQLQQQALGLRALAMANQLRQQQLQQEQLKTQAAQEDQNDQKTIQDAFYENGGDYQKTRDAIASKVRLRNLQAFDQDHMNLVKGLTAVQDEKRKQIINRNTAVGNELLGLLQT